MKNSYKSGKNIIGQLHDGRKVYRTYITTSMDKFVQNSNYSVIDIDTGVSFTQLLSTQAFAKRNSGDFLIYSLNITGNITTGAVDTYVWACTKNSNGNCILKFRNKADYRGYTLHVVIEYAD